MVSFSCGFLDPVMLEHNSVYMSVSFLERININFPPKELPEITRNNVSVHSLRWEEDPLDKEMRLTPLMLSWLPVLASLLLTYRNLRQY